MKCLILHPLSVMGYINLSPPLSRGREMGVGGRGNTDLTDLNQIWNSFLTLMETLWAIVML